jgi:transcriptional regulator with XRE-family HTH domain
MSILNIHNIDTIGVRIKQIRLHLKLNQTAFANKVKLSQNFLSSIENGRSQITINNLISITDIFNINPTWLLTGQEDMFSTTNIILGDDRKEILKNPEFQNLCTLLTEMGTEISNQAIKKLTNDIQLMKMITERAQK